MQRQRSNAATCFVKQIYEFSLKIRSDMHMIKDKQELDKQELCLGLFYIQLM